MMLGPSLGALAWELESSWPPKDQIEQLARRTWQGKRLLREGNITARPADSATDDPLAADVFVQVSRQNESTGHTETRLYVFGMTSGSLGWRSTMTEVPGWTQVENSEQVVQVIERSRDPSFSNRTEYRIELLPSKEVFSFFPAQHQWGEVVRYLDSLSGRWTTLRLHEQQPEVARDGLPETRFPNPTGREAQVYLSRFERYKKAFEAAELKFGAHKRQLEREREQASSSKQPGTMALTKGISFKEHMAIRENPGRQKTNQTTLDKWLKKGGAQRNKRRSH